MNKQYRDKSFNPSDFSIYYSGIDFSRVNVWQTFRRKLPAQIALVCYDSPKTITEIAIELGCASCYLEDEIEILIDAGVVKEAVKGKYQTNFIILKSDEVIKIKKLFKEMYKNYYIEIQSAFDEYLPKNKATKIFKQDVEDNRYKWLFVSFIADKDNRKIAIKDDEFPRILSCGARAFIFVEKAISSDCATGCTPTGC